MDSEPQSELLLLISQLMYFVDPVYWVSDEVMTYVVLLTGHIIPLVSSMDLDSQPQPENNKLMSLTTRAISLFNSMDLNSQPEPLRKFVSFISQNIPLVNSIDSDTDRKLKSLFLNILELEPEPELISLLHQMYNLAKSKDPQWEKLISLCPQVQVSFQEGKFQVIGKVQRCSNNKWSCRFEPYKLTGEDNTHFRCSACNGEDHEEYDKAPPEIKHPLHPKHSLQLVLMNASYVPRECYCCDEDLKEMFYYCPACDYAINIACVEKPRRLSIDHAKWHEHTLTLFPRNTPLTCSVCALTHTSCPFYICPPCDFVVHQNCFSLPRVIRISRHHHRISFTHSFDKGDWSCGVCRRKIDNDYGGYSCIKDGCSYAAHSRCATRSNVWDGKELEEEPDEEDEELKPFVRIRDGIIQHFSHPHHHLKLDDNTDRDYDDNLECQACIRPIYFGNFYSCMQCDFILHEACANLSRRHHHPIHPHMLTLVTKYYNVMVYRSQVCSACPSLCKACFFYECDEQECDFQLHVQCATVSEPLIHESHMHPLFLTSEPYEARLCSVCKVTSGLLSTNETFNCIEECNFALCFKCATLPQKVRYKHDKHMLTLSYGNAASTMTYWCEVCEGNLNPKERFYMCAEDCCVTLHIECIFGMILKPYSWWLYNGKKVYVLPNNRHMTRPNCSVCEKHCPHRVAIQRSGKIYCSTTCLVGW